MGAGLILSAFAAPTSGFAATPVFETFVVVRANSASTSQSYDLADDLSVQIKGERLCADIGQFVEALEFPIRFDVDTGIAEGWFFDEAHPFRLDVGASTIELSGQKGVVDPQGLVKTRDGLCVDLSLLSNWFGLQLNYNARAALIEVASNRPLAFQQRLAREAQRQKMPSSTASSTDKSQHSNPLAYSWFTPPTMDVDMTASSASGPSQSRQQALDVSVLAVGEIARFTSEAFLRTSVNRPPSLRARLYRRNPNGGVFGLNDLTEATFGDVYGQADEMVSAGGYGRGLSLTSFPTATADRFSGTNLTGDLPAGWDAELYRNDILIAAKSSDGSGRFSFADVGVLPGENALKVVLYGPQGQRRVIDYSISAAPMIVPKGRIFARLALFEQGTNLFGAPDPSAVVGGDRGRFEAEVRATPLRSLTLGARVVSFDMAHRRRTFGSLSAATTFAKVSVQTNAVITDQGALAGQLAMDRRFGEIYASVRIEDYGDGFSSERVDRSVQSRFNANLNSSLKLFARKTAQVSLRVRLDQRRDETTSWSVSGQGGVAFNNNWLTQSLNVSGEAVGRPGAKTVPARIEGAFQWSRIAQASSTRWQIDYAVAPVARIDRVSFSYDPIANGQDHGWRVGTNFSFAPQKDVATAGLSASHRLKKATLSFYANVDNRRAVTVGVALSLSIGRDCTRNRWRIEEKAQAQKGRAVARVFTDSNTNGLYDAGERLMPDAIVSITGSNERFTTNAKGEALILGIESETQFQVKVDPDTVTDGLIMPTSGNATTTARAGAVTRVDIPVSLAGSITGRVSESGGLKLHSLRNIVVRLLDSGGSEVAVARTSKDGEYIFDEVALGTYSLVLDSVVSARIGVKISAPLPVHLCPERPDVEVEAMRLVPDEGVLASHEGAPAT
jgi:hypothetical protein